MKHMQVMGQKPVGTSKLVNGCLFPQEEHGESRTPKSHIITSQSTWLALDKVFKQNTIANEETTVHSPLIQSIQLDLALAFEFLKHSYCNVVPPLDS